MPPVDDMAAVVAELRRIANCPECGGAVRLGGGRIRVNRKHGVSHYLAHEATTACASTRYLTCVMMKPYPKRDEDKPWFQMIQRWNEAAALRTAKEPHHGRELPQSDHEVAPKNSDRP